MKSLIVLISIVLMITTFFSNNLYVNSKNSLKNIRNLDNMENSVLNTEENSKSNKTNENNEISQETIKVQNNEQMGELPDNSTDKYKVSNDDKFVTLYAVDNFTITKIFREWKVTFNIYVIFHNIPSADKMIITFEVIQKDSRLLEEEKPLHIQCLRDSDPSLELVRYFCIVFTERDIKNKKLKGVDIYIQEKNLTRSPIIIDNTTSSLEMLNDITKQTMKTITNLDFVYIKNCEFLSKETTPIQIQGETDDDISEKSSLVLDVKNDDGIVKVDSNLFINKNISSNKSLENSKAVNVIIQLNPTTSLNANLNKTTGVLEDGRNVLIFFKKDVDLDVQVSAEPDKFVNNENKNKNKKGLSKGAIAGIVTAGVLVLIAITVTVCLLIKRSSVNPPKQNIVNTTPGIVNNSSTDIVN